MNPEQDVDVDLRRLFASLVENRLRILGVALAATLAAVAFVWLATPLYRAETRILIENRESVFTRPEGVSEAERPILDEEGVTSQVQVIGSTDLLLQVAERLNLGEREEFGASGGLLAALGLGGESNETPEQRVLKIMREKLTVYRVENSRVIVIQFSSEDPKLAAEIANAVADAYIAGQQQAKLSSNEDATGWLEPEIAELRQRVRESEAKVAEFRAKSDLLVGQNNSVLSTQQLAELSTELSRVRANRAAAEANAEGMRAAIAAGASLEAMPEVLASGLIQRLREREVQLKADIADLSTTLLENHPRIRALRSQLADLEAQIRSEAKKIIAGLETEARTARLREEQLVADLNRLKAESARAGGEAVELRALEREAASQRELLETYLAQYREAASRGQANYVPVDARIFSRAIAPAEPYFPKMMPIVGAAFVGSLLVMAIVTLLQELFSGRAMRPAAAAPVPVAMVPAAEPLAVLAEPEPIDDAEFFDPEPVDLEELLLEPLPARAAGLSVAGAAERLIAGGASRALVISPEGDEAAASAVMVAREMSDAGLRVILVDLTMSGAASAPMLDRRPLPGITDLLAARAPFSDVIHGDLYSASDVIPTGLADPEQAMRAAERLPMILESLSTAYDMVVLECGAADAAAIERLAGEGTQVIVSVVEASDEMLDAAKTELETHGFGEVLVVSPDAGAPTAPVPDRSAA